MAEPNNFEIDCFLDQFKRSASRAMEEMSMNRSHSSYLDAESPEESENCEEIEMINTVQLEPIGINDIVDLLQPQHAIISGGKSKDGCPIITFPDNNNFQLLNDYEYQRLILYLTSVPSLQEADLGFHLIIDRRKDRWNSVKTVLLKISVYFPGLIHVVYVLRPAGFIQKALSEVSNKLFKDEFKFRMIVLSTIEELHEYVNLSQLTPDLGGTLYYSHQDWIQQRYELEKFSLMTQQVSNALDEFTKKIAETELPNNVDSTQQLLNKQMEIYSQLKQEILNAARHGEDLLSKIKEKLFNTDNTFSISTDVNGNIFTIERLLVQLEETEKTFDDFWLEHSAKLRHCLELRQFERDFRELQISFESHLKIINEMTEITDTINRLDTLIKDIDTFEKVCLSDLERAEEVVSSGQHLIRIKNCYPLECVEPKCNELVRMRDDLIFKITRRTEILFKYKDFINKSEKIHEFYTIGMNLLESQKIDKCSSSSDLTFKYIQQIENYLKSDQEIIGTNLDDMKSFYKDLSEIKTQLFDKIDEIYYLCEKRVRTLKNLPNNPQNVSSDILPNQPTGGAPHPHKTALKRSKYSKTDSTNLNGLAENDETNNIKIRHILSELLDTERIYVTELLSIITGYKLEAKSEEMQHLICEDFADKIDVIFGNLDEIYNFHANLFLKDIENCITSIDLVALCFVQRKDTFYHLYSYYCQNIPKSEQVRETMSDCNMFFQTCQKKLGHKLPLAAYLLKPVQRITKYQLLLKDLLRYTDEGKYCRELQQALDCMLIVLRCVNDSMHQISITGFPLDLSQQGDLLLQGSFSVCVENKKDIKLRLKPLRRHIFLYQKSMLFCKTTSKRAHNKSTYQFKHYLKMSQIGLTESVKGDGRKFEVWLQGRQEVYTIQAVNIEQKQSWVNEIKRVLLNQLEELKGEKIKQYSALVHKSLRQTTSWEKEKSDLPIINNQRTMSCDTESQIHDIHESMESLETENWSSDGSNTDEEDHLNFPSGRYVALSDYCAIGNSEVNMREGDMVELLKVGCAGWWFVKVIGTSVEGWAPAAYLECLHRKASSSRSCSRSQDKLNDR